MAQDGEERLSSNVMNYLVWRYLQESGYGKTAKQLQLQWMGKDSPEQLPFAPRVTKHCLVNMVQDGMYLDQLQAAVKKACRLARHICVDPLLTGRRSTGSTSSVEIMAANSHRRPMRCVRRRRACDQCRKSQAQASARYPMDLPVKRRHRSGFVESARAAVPRNASMAMRWTWTPVR